jgi:hypothetical protein
MKRGRPKGYTPYVEISYEELADWVGRKAKVVVCKKWLESLMGKEIHIGSVEESIVEKEEQEETPKIEYEITHF